MRYLILASALSLLMGCSLLGLPAQPASNGGSAAPGPAPASAPGAPAPAAPRTDAPAAPSAPSPVSVSLKNDCKETVRLFFGDKPKFGSGTYSTLSSNTRTSKQMMPGDMIWIVDDHDNGLSAFTVSEGSRDATINASCSGWGG